MAKKSIPISLRFVFNRKSGETGKAFGPNTARVIAREVAIVAGDRLWDVVLGKIRSRLIRDGNREIAAIAQQYKRYIIGANGMNRGVTGRLESAAAQEDGTPVSQRLSLSWANRNKDYLRRKMREKKHTRWFEYGGGLKSGIKNPVNQQLQNAMGRTGTWTRAFGPVGVRVTRRSNEFAGYKTPGMLDIGPGLAWSKIDDKHKNRLSIATITVFAFGRITPGMLAGISQDGPASSYPDGRDNGLIDLLPKQIGYRLGGNRETVPYRPTLEPFLEFFLTRSLPNAVTRRLQTNLRDGL